MESGQGLLKTIDMLGNTLLLMEQQIQQITAENQALRKQLADASPGRAAESVAAAIIPKEANHK
jgi:hypothetical protein